MSGEAKAAPTAPTASSTASASALASELEALIAAAKLPKLAITHSHLRFVVRGDLTVWEGSAFNMLLHEFSSKHRSVTVESRVRVTDALLDPEARADRDKFAGEGDKLGVSDAEIQEHYDSEEVVARKARFVADRIRAAKHFVCFTGAGISTAAKIADFRGPQGVWTARDRNLPAPKSIELTKAIPTYTHRALVGLQNSGHLKHLVSQNVDGLHRRSGIRESMISELHGNCFSEICANPKCKAEFLRDFDVGSKRGPYFKGVKDTTQISHITGRKCEKCGEGMLRDSIIHFGENLPENAINTAFQMSCQSDFVLVLGSSLRVNPAAALPQRSQGPFCVLNLQVTGKDKECLNSGGILIHARCDEFMTKVMAELKVAVPSVEDTAKVSEHLVGVTPLSEAAAGGSGIELKAGADGKTITGVVGSDAEAAAAGEDTKTSAFTASEAHATLASHRAAAERPRPIEHDTVWSGNRSALQARLGQRAAQLEVSGKCGGATATVETDRMRPAPLHVAKCNKAAVNVTVKGASGDAAAAAASRLASLTVLDCRDLELKAHTVIATVDIINVHSSRVYLRGQAQTLQLKNVHGCELHIATAAVKDFIAPEVGDAVGSGAGWLLVTENCSGISVHVDQDLDGEGKADAKAAEGKEGKEQKAKDGKQSTTVVSASGTTTTLTVTSTARKARGVVYRLPDSNEMTAKGADTASAGAGGDAKAKEVTAADAKADAKAAEGSAAAAAADGLAKADPPAAGAVQCKTIWTGERFETSQLKRNKFGYIEWRALMQ